MFKIIVILTIVFVNCCEINADSQQLEKKYTTGSGKNMSSLNIYLESFQSNDEGFFNYFKQGVVESQRFSPIHSVEESSQTEELGNESTNSKKSYVNLRRANTHQSTNNNEEEDRKRNVKKKNDSSSFIKSSSDRKHHEHKNRFKIMNRSYSEKSKHITRRQKDHINKDNTGKEKNKDRKEAETKVIYKNMFKGTTEMIVSVSEENKNISNKNMKHKRKRKDKLKVKDKSETIKLLEEDINKRIKQALEKSKDKHKEKSMFDHKVKKVSMKIEYHENKRAKEKSKNKKYDSEKNNLNKTKHAKEKVKTKPKQESKQSKSKDALRTANTNTTAVLKASQASTRVSKRAQKTTTKNHFITPKPPSKLFQKDIHKEKGMVDKGESMKTDDRGKKRAKEESVDKKKEKSENKKQDSEKNNINKAKKAKEKSMTKPKQENKQSGGKDDLRNTKTNTVALLKQSQASTKDTKRTQKITTKKNFSTPKRPPNLFQNIIKKKYYGHPLLRSHKRVKEEPIRATQMSALFLNEDTKGALRDAGNDIEGLPSSLSPYAITSQIELLMKEFPEANATVTKIGSTMEYNDIVLIAIKEKEKDKAFFRSRDSKYMDDVPEKKIIFIVHGLTVMGLKEMTSLVKLYELKILLSYYLKHLDKFDFYLMPLANPDGYSASLSSSNRLWNKNVSPQEACSGVYVDRNFDVAWKSSKDISSCNQLYPGATPFSEEESKAVREIFHNYGHKILAYIHVHAGTFDSSVFKGDAVLYPRGYTVTQSDDDKYIDLKGEIDEAMKNASFRVMSVTVDSLANWYGVVTGSSVDYAASVYGIPYAMEFVMQIYQTESLINNALTEIWSRLIDTTFNNMWKSLQKGADFRKFITNIHY